MIDFRYLVSQPFLRIFTKSPIAAIQSILHTLFLPTPFKVLSEATMSTSKSNSTTPSASTSNAEGASNNNNNKTASSLSLDIPEEVLVPGALYADCAVVVNLTVKLDKNPDDIEQQQMQLNDEVKKSGAATKPSRTNADEDKRKREGEKGHVELPDDGEYGGELAGRLVWEAYEAGLKFWEKENPRLVEEGGAIGNRKEEKGSKGKGTQINEDEFEVEKDAYL